MIMIETPKSGGRAIGGAIAAFGRLLTCAEGTPMLRPLRDLGPFRNHMWRLMIRPRRPGSPI